MFEQQAQSYLRELCKTQKRFFALCHELGYQPDKAKQRAKEFFKEEDSFNCLTINQLYVLIDKMLLTKQQHEQQNPL